MIYMMRDFLERKAGGGLNKYFKSEPHNAKIHTLLIIIFFFVLPEALGIIAQEGNLTDNSTNTYLFTLKK